MPDHRTGSDLSSGRLLVGYWGGEDGVGYWESGDGDWCTVLRKSEVEIGWGTGELEMGWSIGEVGMRWRTGEVR